MKKGRGSTILAVVLGILVVLGIAGDVFFFLSGRSGAIKQTAEAGQQKQEEQQKDLSDDGQKTVEGTIENFQVAKSESPQNSQEDSENKDSEYLCDYSSSRLMTEADLAALKSKTYDNLPEGKNIIQMVINELYAKKGFTFQSAEIQAYFDAKPWYQSITDRTSDMDVASQRMTDLEKKNINFLNSHTE